MSNRFRGTACCAELYPHVKDQMASVCTAKVSVPIVVGWGLLFSKALRTNTSSCIYEQCTVPGINLFVMIIGLRCVK
jgi:hypothetical protein